MDLLISLVSFRSGFIADNQRYPKCIRVRTAIYICDGSEPFIACCAVRCTRVHVYSCTQPLSCTHVLTRASIMYTRTHACNLSHIHRYSCMPPSCTQCHVHMHATRLLPCTRVLMHATSLLTCTHITMHATPLPAAG